MTRRYVDAGPFGRSGRNLPLLDNGAGGANLLADGLFAIRATIPVSVVSNPSNVSVQEGQAANFTASFSGDAPLTLQWKEYIEEQPILIGGAYSAISLGTAASPSAVSIDVPADALAVVVHVVGSSDGVTPTGLTALTCDFATLTRSDEPGTLSNICGSVAYGKITSTGTGKLLTASFGGPNTLSGASVTVYFLSGVDPDDFMVGVDTAGATGGGATAATATVASRALGLVIAADTRIDTSNAGVYPSNEGGWTSLNTALTSSTYQNTTRLRKVTTPVDGTASATTQNTSASVITLISLKGRSSVSVSAGNGSTTSSYTTPATTLSMSGKRYWCEGTNSFGTAKTTEAVLTVTEPADTISPNLPGSITVSSITTTTFTSDCPAATDNVAVTGYEVSLNGGTSWIDKGASRTHGATGQTPGALVELRWRAYDAAGLRSAALSAQVQMQHPGLLGSTIIAATASGDHGPGVIYPSLRPGDEAKRYYITITRPVVNGTLDIDTLGAFTYTGTADYFDFDLFENSVNLGSVRVDLLFASARRRIIFIN